MKMLAFARRTAREILRDPLTFAFGLGFPVALLLLMSAIQANIPVPLFRIEKLAPGIAVFGLSFLTVFSASLIARDRESALLQRLYTSPLSPTDFLLGYALPILPMALGQGGLCYTLALALGLPLSVNLLGALALLLPVALLYIALGLLCGSVLPSKQVGGVCGALLTNLTAFLSGVWFDLELVGGSFQAIARTLPFFHAVELERLALSGAHGSAMAHLPWVLGYALGVLAIAAALFLRQMRRR